MATRTLISVDEYLTTSYRPDCDFVDGEVVERNLGEWDHSSLQSAILVYLWNRCYRDGIRTVAEQRVQVKPTRFRIPDVCVVLGEPGEKILTKPPFICIEVLSPEDRMSHVRQRIADYLEMGVPYAWVLDPETKQAYTATSAEGLREVKTGVLKTENPAIEVPVSEVFA
ncbi:MAG TPA: Uma2 family endonuclease [Bryobacteraceae bacterium]|jgi:Uma2 family endonuclease